MGNKQAVPEPTNLTKEEQLINILNFYTNINDKYGNIEWLKWKDDEGKELTDDEGKELDVFLIIAQLTVYLANNTPDVENEKLFIQLLRKYNIDKIKNMNLTQSIKTPESNELKF